MATKLRHISVVFTAPANLNNMNDCKLVKMSKTPKERRLKEYPIINLVKYTFNISCEDGMCVYIGEFEYKATTDLHKFICNKSSYLGIEIDGYDVAVDAIISDDYLVYFATSSDINGYPEYTVVNDNRRELVAFAVLNTHISYEAGWKNGKNSPA